MRPLEAADGLRAHAGRSLTALQGSRDRPLRGHGSKGAAALLSYGELTSSCENGTIGVMCNRFVRDVAGSGELGIHRNKIILAVHLDAVAGRQPLPCCRNPSVPPAWRRPGPHVRSPRQIRGGGTRRRRHRHRSGGRHGDGRTNRRGGLRPGLYRRAGGTCTRSQSRQRVGLPGIKLRRPVTVSDRMV
jgi:hypothetical protein